MSARSLITASYKISYKVRLTNSETNQRSRKKLPVHKKTILDGERHRVLSERTHTMKQYTLPSY